MHICLIYKAVIFYLFNLKFIVKKVTGQYSKCSDTLKIASLQTLNIQKHVYKKCFKGVYVHYVLVQLFW